MISTRQLRYFVEIADSGSFSAAAERLFVAQSALSRQIKALETQLQTSLFERTARQPRLTAAGEAFYPRARNLLSELLKASEMATQVGKGQLGTLRLSHSSTVPMSGPLLHGISTWLQRCPGVSMDIVKLSSEASVCAVGPIGFVGLIAPNIIRQFLGNDYRWLIPLSAALGAVIVLGADLLSRAVAFPVETPAGVVTALIGAPFFLFLARRAL